MKKVLVIGLFILLFAAYSNAQDCVFFYPETKGAELEYKSYDSKDKLTGVSKQKIKDITKSGNTITAVIEVQYFDKNMNELMHNDFTVKCENGIFYLDMKNFMNPQSMGAVDNLEASVESSNLQLPSNMKAGDKLNDGSLTITLSNNGMKMMNMTTNITNRVVQGKENVTTPAGTFDCFKISSDISSKSIITVNVKSVEWYAKDVGVVKVESYSSNGKLSGYTVLTSIKQ